MSEQLTSTIEPGSSKFDQSVYNAYAQVLDNQTQYLNQFAPTGYSSDSKRKLSDRELVMLTAKMLNKLSLHQFMSLQPLTGPVGLVRVQDLPFAVESGSLKLTSTINLDEYLPDQLETVALDTARHYDRFFLTHIAEVAPKPALLEDDHFANVVTIITECAQDLGINNEDHIGNWAIIPKYALENLMECEKFQFIQAPNPETPLTHVGTLKVLRNHRIRIFTSYEQPVIPRHDILVGYRDYSEAKAATHRAVFSPYIPFVSSGIVRDPVTFAPKMSFLTRFGHHLQEDGVKEAFRKVSTSA